MVDATHPLPLTQATTHSRGLGLADERPSMFPETEGVAISALESLRPRQTCRLPLLDIDKDWRLEHSLRR